MKNLIPEFILEKNKKGIYKGKFQAFSFFVDISGFTKTTETLVPQGKIGAEIIVDILKFLYKKSIEQIYQYNGFISGYAGDSFTAIFPIDNLDKKELEASRVLKISEKIRNFYEKNRIYKTDFGDFEFGVKIGVGFGEIRWIILGTLKDKTFLFHGSALDNCIFAEQKAKRGEVYIDQHIFSYTQKYIEEYKKNKNYYKLISLKKFKIHIEKNNKFTKLYSKDKQKIFCGFREVDFPETGEFRNVITLFISFKGINNINSFISLVIEKLKLYGGSHIKIDYGDKGFNIILHFGAPITYENNEERAIRFVLDLKTSIKKKNSIRGGLTKGNVYVGFNGAGIRQEFACLGLNVNLASRLMMKAKWGKILADDKISKNKNFNFLYEGSYKYKGFNDYVKTYSLEIKKSFLYNREYISDFYGREQELDKLDSFIKPMWQNKFSGILYIEGQPGIGKTRIVEEFQKRLEKDYNITWIYMPCDEIIRKSYNPLIYFLKDFFKQNDDKGNNRIIFLEKYRKLINKINNKDLIDELKHSKPFIASLLNIFWKNSLYEKLDPESRNKNIMFSLKTFFKVLSLFNPLIIELDDINWIDNESKFFLEKFMINIDNYPISIICTCRYNEDNSSFNLDLNKDFVTRISLKNIDKNKSKKIIKSILKKKVRKFTNPDNNFYELIYKRSEGNPFYIEQILLYIIEKRGNFNFTGENNLNKIQIPSSINYMIISRIDQLSVEIKETIKTASVIGKDFFVKLLSNTLNRQNISSFLNIGEEKFIWDKLNELKYTFKSVLLKDTVYSMQLEKRLSCLHRLVAENIEKLYKKNLKQFYYDLAFHYQKAKDKNKIIYYLKKAADFSYSNYRNEEALQYYKKLLDYEEEKNKILKIKIKISDILNFTSKWIEAESSYKDVISLAKELKQYKTIAKLKYDQGFLMQKMGKPKECYSIYKKAINFCKNKNLVIDEFIISEKLNFFKGNYSVAIKFNEKIIEIAKKEKDFEIYNDSLNNLGVISFYQGDFINALKYFKKKLKISKKLKDKKKISISYTNLGSAYANLDNLVEARKYFNYKIKISKELGDMRGLSFVYCNIGNIYGMMINFNKAMEFYKKALKFSKEIDDKEQISVVYSNIGMLYLNNNKFKQAIDYFNIYLKLSKETDNFQEIGNAYYCLGQVYMELNKHEKSIEYYKKAQTIFEKLDAVQVLILLYFLISKTYYNKKKYKIALQYLDKSKKMEEKSNSKKISYKIEILLLKIKYRNNQKLLLKNLKKLETQYYKDVELAEIYFQIWDVEKSFNCT